MRKHLVLGIAAFLAGACAALPVFGQAGDFRILPPDVPRVVDGACTLRWSDPNPFEEGCTSITWYYSRDSGGRTRKRVASLFRDDFSRNFRANWRLAGPFQADWAIRQDAEHGRYLAGRRGAGACTSWAEAEGNIAVSVLARPQGPRNEFGIGIRTQQDGSGYYVLNDGANLRLVRRTEQNDEPLDRDRPVPLGEAAAPGNWYWYEVSLCTMPRVKAVELRVRVFDEKHERVLVDCRPYRTRCAGDRACEAGAITLLPPADFAEIYVDPWQARWADRGDGEFRWDTRDVEEGKYWLIAELADGKTRRPVVSQFMMEVANPRRAARSEKE